MEIVGQYRKPFAISAVSIRLPWYVWIALVMLTHIALIVIGVIVVATRHEMSDPFSDFRDLLSDDARQAALARGFTCHDMESRSQPLSLSGYCAQRNTDQIFSGIFVQMSGSDPGEISFWPREDTLTLGDLVLLWGQPEFRLYCEVIVAYWPARHITSLLGAPRTGQITYFAPVLLVSFTRRGAPQWGRTLILMNDARHDCGRV